MTRRSVWKYTFRGLFGLLVYAAIRVINDSTSHSKFWLRPWTTTAIEIAFCLLAAYVMMYAFGKLFEHFDKTLQHTINYKIVLQELTWVVIITEVVNNAIITPM